MFRAAILGFAAVLFMLASLPPPSIAGVYGAYLIRQCTSEEDVSDEQRILACTSVLSKYQGSDEVPYLLLARGLSYERVGKLEKARDDFEGAIKLKNNFVDAWTAYGNVMQKLGVSGYPLIAYDAALKLNPHNGEALNNSCWVRATLGVALDAALAMCNEALDIKANDPVTLDSRCLLRFRLSDYANAIADCDAALKLRPRAPSTLYVRGLAKIRLGYVEMGNVDIAAARALDSKIADTFSGFGVKP